MEVLPYFRGRIGSLNSLVLSDHVLRLGRSQSARLPCIRGYSGGKDVPFGRQVFQSTFGDFYSGWSGAFYCHGKNNILCSRECEVVLDWPQAFNLWLVFDGVEHFVDEEPQQSEVLFPLESLEWIR